MRSCKVELLRFGKDTGAFMDRYLVGVDGCPVRTVEPEPTHEGVLRALNQLRYGADVTAQQQQDALTLLTKLIESFLCDVLTELATSKGPVQIDVVTDKVELWSLPFEFLCDRSGHFVLENPDRSILLTRRVRGSFGESMRRWPEKPRVLFAWAGAVAADPHREALFTALEPWIGPHDEEMVRDTKPVFTELGDATVEDISEACQRAVDQSRPYTHIHLLAHGRPIEDVIPALGSFGVALHDRVVSAEILAEAMGAGRDLGPTVITLAVCDSANATNTLLAGGRIAYQLHAKGVPVVVGSQFPLTEVGSQIYARTFYKALLADHEDVRVALANARSALASAKPEETGHDWVSITAHLRLPEGYADQIAGAALRVGLAHLNTTSRWGQRIVEGGESASQRLRDDMDARFAARLAYLESWLENVKHDSAAVLECVGLIASAYKRWAELEFGAGRPDSRERSRELLARAEEWYFKAHDQALSHHWTGTQHLAVKAALTGGIPAERTVHWLSSYHAAKRAAQVDSIKDDDTRRSVIWCLGSIAELCLLAPLLQMKPDQVPTIADAQQALERMVQLADGSASLKGELDSAWRQWRRYVRWWTTGNGFFPSMGVDLSTAARKLLAVLPPPGA